MEMVSLGIPDCEDKDVCVETFDASSLSKLIAYKDIPFTNNKNKSCDIKLLKCGGNHTLILLENGILLGSGELRELCNDFQLFNGWCVLNYRLQELVAPELTNLTSASIIDSISTCWDSSFIGIKFLQENTIKIFSFGLQFKSELGRPSGSNRYLIMESGPDCESLTLHSCLYTTISRFQYTNNNVSLYGWGLNNKQQLFRYVTKADKIVTVPKLLDEYKDNAAIDFILGKDFLFILNYTEDYIECLGNEKLKASIAKNVPSLRKMAHITAMWSSVHFIYEDNRLVSLGNGSLGQLSLDGNKLKPVKLLQCGSEHIIYSSIEAPHIVTSWGWGEHGNCGSFDKNKNENEQKIFTSPNNILNIQENKNYAKISNVYGGCATTFIKINKAVNIDKMSNNRI
ncbi:hypothetical protein QEN19_000563 [Hanseniaspora menglaensis]